MAKFLCVLIMVFIHSAFALVANNDEQIDLNNPIVPFLAQAALLGMFPMSIPATAGANLRLHLERYWDGNRIRGYPLRTILKVSVAITLLGFVMNFLAWGIGEAFQWDVLQFVGISFLILTLLLKYANLHSVYALGLLALGLTPWLRTQLVGREDLATTLLVGARIADGYWPFFPWFFIVAFGFSVGDLRTRFPNAGWIPTVLGLGGIALMAAAFATGHFSIHLDEGHLWGSTIFQPRLGFVVGLAGFFCCLLAISEWIAGRLTLARYGIVQSFSKGVLWIYLFHVSLVDHLGPWVSRLLPPWWAVLFYPAAMALACWAVGALTLRLAGKRIRVIVARTA